MKCTTCGGKLKRLRWSSEPEGLRRDAECTVCHTRFMVTKACLAKLPKQPRAKRKKQFVVRVVAYEGEGSSIALSADFNDTLGEMYCVGVMSDDGIVDLIDNGYASLGELYEAWPELKSWPELGPKTAQFGNKIFKEFLYEGKHRAKEKQ